MKITQVTGAEAIRLIQVGPLHGQTLYGIKLVRAFEARFGFLQGPKILDDFDLSKGVTFLHGYFDKKYVIDRVQLFNNGMLVNCKETTKLCDDVIDDIVDWAAEEAGLRFETVSPLRIYNSGVEVQMNGNFAGAFDKFSSVSSAISNLLRSYGAEIKDFEVTTLHLWAETGRPGPNPFKFERRFQTPFESNLFFSSAPLTTEDHTEILELLEKSIS